MKKALILVVSLALTFVAASAQEGQVKLKYSYADLEPYIDSTTIS